MANQQAIVTRESLQHMLNHSDQEYVARVVGRALVRIFERQTASEQHANDTTDSNGIGFAGCDAKSGSMTAKFFMKHHRLETWQVERWTKKGKNGFARLCKYHAQLNEIAMAKQAK